MGIVTVEFKTLAGEKDHVYHGDSLSVCIFAHFGIICKLNPHLRLIRLMLVMPASQLKIMFACLAIEGWLRRRPDV
jgi:hypothetical protein